MKRIIFLFGLLLTVFSFSVSNEAFGKHKYKIKLKGAAARAYIRSHHLVGTQSNRTAYHHRRHRNGSVAVHRHTTNRYAHHTTARTHRVAAVSHRRHYGNRTAYHRTRNNGYRGFAASSYAGYRQGGVRWNKLKIKQSDDKTVYKYKR